MLSGMCSHTGRVAWINHDRQKFNVAHNGSKDLGEDHQFTMYVHVDYDNSWW